MNDIQVLNNADTNISIKAFTEIDKLKNSILDTRDLVTIKWKRYINKRWYRKLAIAFNISTEIVKEERIEKDNLVIYDFSIRATSPVGRYMESSASCASNERDFNHIENDVRAIAQTRATNRCISDLIGLWEVSYEEMKYESSNIKWNLWEAKNNTRMQSYSTGSDWDRITQKQRNLLIRLVESKYQDDSTRNILYKKIYSLSKSEARDTIKWLIEEWVEI